MGQSTESSETCADRPTEVSVIRFVSRNRTIEEITPKKEVYICKQRGCGKIFTNQDEYKTHEAFEALKIRFICREPGCGEELSDPGSMWRHYQEWHNNETNVLICPYTSCSSVHASSEILEKHIESSHRQLPTISTEPEIIYFEGPDNAIEEDINRVIKDGNSLDIVPASMKKPDDDGFLRKNEYFIRNETFGTKQNNYNIKEEKRIINTKTHQKEEYTVDQSKLRAALSYDEYSNNNEALNRVGTKFPKNKDLLITKENFLVKYETRSPVCNENVQVDSCQDDNKTIFLNSDVSLIKNSNQEHRIQIDNLEKVFKNGFERDSIKSEEVINEVNTNCSDDEEYTPKKQRMSRCKQEPYKCEINGCGKTYKYISHYRHHQESHKLITNQVAYTNSTKTLKPKLGKATTVSFFICKMPGCGAQLSNVTTLWKHYQDTHANVKPPTPAKCNEMFRCKITGCEMEFATSIMLYKHFSDAHTKNSTSNNNSNVKTGNGNGILVEQMYHDDTTTQRVNFKTDLKTKLSLGLNKYADINKNIQSSVIKEELGD